MWIFKSDIKNEISNWLVEINNENRPDGLVAINIGIFESNTGYVLYVLGANEYSLENNDWAATNFFEPKKKYFFINEKSLNELNWEDFLKKIEQLLREIVGDEVFDKTILSSVRHVTFGFDDGDLQVLI